PALVSEIANSNNDPKRICSPNADRHCNGWHGHHAHFLASWKTIGRALQSGCHPGLLAAWKSEKLGCRLLHNCAIRRRNCWRLRSRSVRSRSTVSSESELRGYCARDVRYHCCVHC